MNNKFTLIIGVIVDAAAFLTSSMPFTVTQRKQAMIFKLGDPIKPVSDPGEEWQ